MVTSEAGSPASDWCCGHIGHRFSLHVIVCYYSDRFFFHYTDRFFVYYFDIYAMVVIESGTSIELFQYINHNWPSSQMNTTCFLPNLCEGFMSDSAAVWPLHKDNTSCACVGLRLYLAFWLVGRSVCWFGYLVWFGLVVWLVCLVGRSSV